MNGKRVLHIILLSSISVFATGVVFLSIWWFSNSVTDILVNRKDFLQSSLETAIDSAKASVDVNSFASVSLNFLPLRDWRVEDLRIGAQSAIAVEIGSEPSKVLFKKNEEKKLPIASLTKLMTALVVLDNYDMTQKVTVDSLAMAQEGEQGNLALGQVLTVKDLLYITLMESSNRSAYALSEVVGPNKFIALMNDKAQKMGLGNSHFQDATGLNQGSYSTVSDLVVLSEYLFKNYPLFREITSLKEYNLYLADGSLHHKLVSTNEFLGQNNVVAGKTGFTNEALGCFMVVQTSPQKGNYIISIVLGAKDRFLEMNNVINWVNTAYQW